MLHGSGCSSLFIEPPAWLPESEDNERKLNCPKCGVRIGEVIWSGKMCSCQEWVTPALQVHVNKVDHIRPLQFAEKTN